MSIPTLAFRAAYDLGSGATKVGIGYKLLGQRSHQSPSQEWRMLFETERVALVGIAVRASADGSIPDTMCQLLRSILTDFRREEEKAVARALREHSLPPATTHYTFQRCGIATATYREASNGPAVMAALQEEFKLPIKIISQEAEGALGFLAASILVREHFHRMKWPVPQRMVAWDSGGASFQLTLGNPISGEVHSTWGKHWGTSRAAATLIRDVQHREFREGVTANPVTEGQFAQLVRTVEADCNTDVPQWLRDYCQRPNAVVATIGGPSNAFTACSKICGKAVLTQQDVETTFLRKVANRDDEAIAALAVPQPDLLAGKLAIVLGVMRSASVGSFRHFNSSGNTRSLMASDAYWSDSHSSSKL
jgi:hypothetical protein